MCETYTYDDSTKTITLNCIDSTETIKVVSYSGNKLVLDFDDYIKKFERETCE